MSMDFTQFGDLEQVTLHDVQREAERRAMDEAKTLILNRLLHITADHEGRYLRPDKWEYLRDFVESL